MECPTCSTRRGTASSGSCACSRATRSCTTSSPTIAIIRTSICPPRIRRTTVGVTANSARSIPAPAARRASSATRIVRRAWLRRPGSTRRRSRSPHASSAPTTTRSPRCCAGRRSPRTGSALRIRGRARRRRAGRRTSMKKTTGSTTWSSRRRSSMRSRTIRRICATRRATRARSR